MTTPPSPVPDLSPAAKNTLKALRNFDSSTRKAIDKLNNTPEEKEQLKQDATAYPFHGRNDTKYWSVKNRLSGGHFSQDMENICTTANKYKNYPQQYNKAKQEYDELVSQYGDQDERSKRSYDRLQKSIDNMAVYRRGKNLLRGPFSDYPADGQAAAIGNSLAENQTFDPKLGETTAKTKLGSVGHGTEQWTYPTRVHELVQKTLDEQPWLLRQVNDDKTDSPPLTRADLQLQHNGHSWGYPQNRTSDVRDAYNHILSHSSEEANADLMAAEDTRAPARAKKNYPIVAQDEEATELTKEERDEGKEPFHHVREIMQREPKQLVKDFGEDPDKMTEQQITKLSRQIKAAAYTYILERPVWSCWKAQARAAGAECAQPLVNQWRDEISAEQSGLPVARVGDAVLCPNPLHGMTIILKGSENVTAEGSSNAHAGSPTSCGATLMTAGCNKSITVNGQPMARIGTRTSHGGIVLAGAKTVALGNGGPAVSLSDVSQEKLDTYYSQIIDKNTPAGDVAEQFMNDHAILVNEQLRTELGKTMMQGAREKYYKANPEDRPK